ncbi:Hypothetical protein PHPALM_14168 [Phytophthora palmivora]|uniref:Uncharacterized protein n=1 Tax=Phytophthora palmivora TaxID=4796 RepID=A0A2P4XVG1_9STRA|nr:Hypothetical protein PHPALM_14168 [Phytophthora palmivora]
MKNFMARLNLSEKSEKARVRATAKEDKKRKMQNRMEKPFLSIGYGDEIDIHCGRKDLINSLYNPDFANA